jgi:hypothetical protein
MQPDNEFVEAELAAALVAGEESALPPALAARITAAGELAVRRDAAPVVDLASRRPARWPTWAGWAAAAAVTVWAIGGRAPQRDGAPAASDLRAALLASAGELSWSPGGDATGASAHGDVVWSDSAQSGVMRFHNLSPNDPRTEQYQLWIFDASRDERYPVDGGVFNVPADSGEVLIPITPRIPVSKATLFVVTVERPGGVVVSDRSRIALLAKRPTDT